MFRLDEFDFSITVVGLGLIGGSFAAALKELEPKNIWGVDIDTASIKIAEEKGFIEKGFTDAKEPLSKSDIVIVALYPKAAVNFIKQNMNIFKKGTIITDTAGLKGDMINCINIFLRDDLDFIGGHPMAGREGQGIQMASKDIFRGANYIFTPSKENNPENVKLLKDMAYKLGCGRVLDVEPEEHDKIVAFTSQLPHIIAISLMNCSKIQDIDKFIGNSFKDVTRVAINNSNLWSEIMLENKKELVPIIEEFEKNIENIKHALEITDVSGLKEEFKKANDRRKELV